MILKTLFLGLFIIILGIVVNAQQYNHLVIENAQWKVEYDDDATPWPDEMYGWLLRGDTIINNIQYKKLYSRVFEDPSSNVIISQLLHGFLREDTVNRIVYAYGDQYMGCDSIGEEFILFDFSYEIGDTSQLCSQTEWIDYCIIMDTSYQNMFGADRKILVFDNGSCIFIEGIGHEQGLLDSPMINMSGGVYHYLSDYCVGTDEECNVLYVKVNEPSQTVHYLIYPNPFDNYIKVESAQKIQQIIIYNLSGEIIKVVEVNDNTSLTETSNIKAGMYFLEVFIDSQLSYRCKLMKINSP
jgi:hypothetical protein